MTKLSASVEKIRSKNAGPFWLTVDIFCGSSDAFAFVRQSLKTDAVAALFQVTPDDVKRYDIPDLNVVKFSLPRPTVQGMRSDRDMHGASYANLLAALEI